MACDISGGEEGISLTDCFLLKPDGTTVASVYDRPATIVNILVRNIFLLAGIALFLGMIYAGFQLAMNPSSKDKGDAKDMLKNAAIGFMVMFSAYWIVQIIEVVTGTNII